MASERCHFPVCLSEAFILGVPLAALPTCSEGAPEAYVAKAAARGCRGHRLRGYRSFTRFQHPRNSEFKLTGHASLSAQLQLKVHVAITVSICLGAVCGGVKADGFWEAAMGVDMALTTTTCGASGLDADGVGCSEWTFESKLTNYAEYPPSDGVSSPCHHGA